MFGNMENNKKFVGSNKAQIAYLCQYMAGHPEFAAGDYRTPLGASYNPQWESLKRALDELGPQRSVEQWKICWRDQKRKARDEGPPISDNTVHVLNATSQEMAVGCGPEESPIGFSQETTTPLSALRQLQAEHAQEPFPSTSGIPKKRTRKLLPPDRFLAAQLAANALRREANDLRREANDLRREALITAQKHLAILIAKDKKKNPSVPAPLPPPPNRRQT
ncbi:uncharacterized protein LOC123870819 isoform X2 [Maniola jurtina]|uniref:uncharacterized protein LOC123870819 isoform X2 n=1 Tax=Maniola jurtina TaxID=191418 RepID=UPI001E68E9D5|nr:uncharacterized protein LOC123870819 isoform X2 [Maniola jurtina]